MKVANKLMADKAGSIKEIALSLGYVDAGKFSAKFKEHYGFLPSKINQ